jgi:chromosome partitioning protein
MGHKVLCVDMDPQANLTVGLGLNARDIEVSIANVLLDPSLSIEDIVEQTGTANVDVAPSDIDLSATENQLFSVIGREHALREVLHGWAEKQYAYIIIDCPPTLGLLTLNALVASDGVVIPVQTQYYSLKGFTALNTVITQIRAKGLNPRLRILGILPTFYDGRTNLAKDMLAELGELGDHHIFETIVRQTVRLGEAPLAGKPITSYASTSGAAGATPTLRRGGPGRPGGLDQGARHPATRAGPTARRRALPARRRRAPLARRPLGRPDADPGHRRAHR